MVQSAQNEPKAQVVSLKLNPDGVVAPTLRAIEVTTDLLAIALPAIAAADLDHLEQLGPFGFTLKTNNTAEARKAAVRASMLAKGFQELANGVRQMLEQAFIYVRVIEVARTAATFGQLQVGFADAERRANRMNFPDLAAAVQKRLDAQLEFAEEFHSLQDVRNCLEHRRGVVGDADVNEGGKLVLRLPRLKIFTEQNGEEIEIFAGQVLAAAASISLKREIRRREYAVGERVEFSAEEFGEIAHACWFFAEDVGKKLPQVQMARRGVPIAGSGT